MMEHLTDEQMAEWLTGALSDSGAGQHLTDCRQCSHDVECMAGAITGFAAIMRDEAAQRQLQPLATLAPAMHGSRLVWAAALAMLAIAALMLRWTPPPERQQSAASHPSDDMLLLEIQQDLNREVPKALAPALVLTAERNRIIGRQNATRNR